MRPAGHKLVLLHQELAALVPCLSGRSRVLCLVGGGGKSSLLFALGEALCGNGHTVLCATTAKMWVPRPSARLEVRMADDPLSLRPSRGRPLFIYPPPPPGAEAGKAHGYSPACIDALAERGLADWILVEADGSRNRPIKAPAAYEPVIPASACAVLGVIGLGCLNKAFTPELVHRMTEFAAVTGLRPGETITPAAAASLVLHPAGLFKNSPALRCLFCNQSDLPGAHEAGEALLQEIHRRAGQAAPHAWIGSVLRDGLLCRSGGRERGPLV